jgi:hypothetical protein
LERKATEEGKRKRKRKEKRKVQTDKFRQFNSEGKVRITKYDKDNETRQSKSKKNRVIIRK